MKTLQNTNGAGDPCCLLKSVTILTQFGPLSLSAACEWDDLLSLSFIKLESSESKVVSTFTQIGSNSSNTWVFFLFVVVVVVAWALFAQDVNGVAKDLFIYLFSLWVQSFQLREDPSFRRFFHTVTRCVCVRLVLPLNRANSLPLHCGIPRWQLELQSSFNNEGHIAFPFQPPSGIF